MVSLLPTHELRERNAILGLRLIPDDPIRFRPANGACSLVFSRRPNASPYAAPNETTRLLSAAAGGGPPSSAARGGWPAACARLPSAHHRCLSRIRSVARAV